MQRTTDMFGNPAHRVTLLRNMGLDCRLTLWSQRLPRPRSPSKYAAAVRAGPALGARPFP